MISILHSGDKGTAGQVNLLVKSMDNLTELAMNVANTLNEQRFTPNNFTYNELASS